MAIDDRDTTYTCLCLNVRLRPQSPPATPPDSVSGDSEYTPLFVGEEGITVNHPQVTVRTISLSFPVPQTTRNARYTALSCLICHVSVYRVHQIVSPEVEGVNGPLLPTDDWVEQETLKSANGWIEVHKDCLTGEAISQVEKSSCYSRLFAVALPRQSTSVAEPISETRLPSTPTPPTQSPPPAVTYLPHMRPLLLPPPFTPSHPVFAHLSGVALQKSQDLRNAAEEHISRIVKEKVAEIEQAEAELRKHVEALWREFKQGLAKVEQERDTSRPLPRQRESETWPISSGGATGSGGQGTPVSVRDFVPVFSPQRASTTSPPPKRSSLSASLATSSFHHPRDHYEQGSSSPSPWRSQTPGSYSSKPTSPTLLSPSGSSLSSHGSSGSQSLRGNLEAGSILEPFRRNMDQSLDVAASFRYFTNLEAEMARVTASRQQAEGRPQEPTVSQDSQANQPDDPPTAADVHEKKSEKPRTNGSGSRTRRDRSTSADRMRKESGEESYGKQENGAKGKRKVTFDVKPDVVTIKREMNAEKEDENTAPQEEEEMIFDLEDDSSERASDTSSKPVFQLLEHPTAPVREPRVSRSRQSSSAGLPQSFLSLRPASLPAPSDVRLSKDQDDTAFIMPNSLKDVSRPMAPRRNSLPDLGPQEDFDALDLREEEILKLVAADTPSHRGAWRKDSKAWQTFVRRQGGKTAPLSRGIIAEESEDDDHNAYDIDRADLNDSDSDDSDLDDTKWPRYKSSPIASSLPIAIGPFGKRRETLSLSSYQPKTSLSDRPGLLVPRLHKSSNGRTVSSSVALRKAAYAERDRSRSMDPGALDFAVEDEEHEHSDNGDSAMDEVETGERGRHRALKILQARSEIPSAGMWRSLA